MKEITTNARWDDVNHPASAGHEEGSLLDVEIKPRHSWSEPLWAKSNLTQ